MKADTVNEFFGTLLQSVTEAHKEHLSTGKYSAHKALDEYYNDMPDAVDALIEHYQGLRGKLTDGFVNGIENKGDFALYLEELAEMCNVARMEWFEDDDALCSDIDNIVGIISSTLYQLRELKESKTTKKTLIILEKTDGDLQIVSDNDTIYLEGVFTEFGIKNRNNRIYSANDFVPKMMELMPSVKAHTLLGELDHPTNFDVSLQNASHVIEDLRYDEANNRIIGKIRLLNTRAGKDAQALVRDGIPLHISSRASGSVDSCGRVTLDKLFTYDLVAEPGFANAELHRVSESYTFDGNKENTPQCLNEQFGLKNNKNVRIYECDVVLEKENIEDTNMNKIVNQDDFQKYTEYVAGVLEGMKRDINELKNGSNVSESTEMEGLRKYCNYLAESIENVANDGDNKKVQELSEKLDNLVKYNNYLAEELEKNGKHNDYLAEQLEVNFKHNDYLAEELEKNCEHNDYLAEQLENNFKHNDYLAENMNVIVKHNDYLAEQLENNFKHNDYLAEKLNTAYMHNDYLAEQLEKNCEHNNYLAEQLENTCNNAVNEGVKTEGEALNESKRNDVVENITKANTYKDSINEKLDQLLRKADEKVSTVNFMNLLSEKRQNEYANLDVNTQNMISEAMKNAEVKNEAQANVVWKMVYESKKGLDIVDNMPQIYAERWEALSDKRKGEILNEAKFYNIKSQDEINYFWSTRDLRETQIVSEKLDTDSAKMWNINQDKNDEHINNILNRAKRNLGR